MQNASCKAKKLEKSELDKVTLTICPLASLWIQVALLVPFRMRKSTISEARCVSRTTSRCNVMFFGRSHGAIGGKTDETLGSIARVYGVYCNILQLK